MNGDAYVTKEVFEAAQGETAEELGKIHGMFHNFLASQREFMEAQATRDKAQVEREKSFYQRQENRDRLYSEKLENLAGEQRKIVTEFKGRLETIEAEQIKLRRKARQSSHEIEERVGEAVEDITGRFNVDQSKLEIMRLNDELARKKSELEQRNSMIKRYRGGWAWLAKAAIGGAAIVIWEIVREILFKH